MSRDYPTQREREITGNQSCTLPRPQIRKSYFNWRRQAEEKAGRTSEAEAGGEGAVSVGAAGSQRLTKGGKLEE